MTNEKIHKLASLDWRATFHGTVPNPSAPGGKVDMWLLVDDETGDGIITLGVPSGRSDIAGYVAGCCSNPARMLARLIPIRPPEFDDLARDMADSVFDAVCRVSEKHSPPGKEMVINGYVAAYSLAMAFLACSAGLTEDKRGLLLFEFLRLATCEGVPQEKT